VNDPVASEARHGEAAAPAVDAGAAAARFCVAFPAAYLAFHRRDGKRDELSGASRAVLTHLAQAGPSTVGELADHLDRAQSVVSEIATQLDGHGLLEREPDPADRRRHLLWLTEAGVGRLSRDRQVLERQLVEAAMRALHPADRAALLDGLEALVRAATPASPQPN
jgi:DNA-binding MarR family transcriptional regulator